MEQPTRYQQRTLALLENHLKSWNAKPAVRMIYDQWFKDISFHLVPGNALEIGCGIGKLGRRIPGLISLDLVATPWADLAGNAQILPLKARSISNLIMIDVLHHLPQPSVFFAEAFRVLRNDGRLIILEPYMSPVSKLVYRKFHPEPVRMYCDPLRLDKRMCSDEPFDANQAVATQLFFIKRMSRAKRSFLKNQLGDFDIIFRKRFSFLAYPASGGLRKTKLLPDKIIRLLQQSETLLIPFAGLLAFRALIVLKKNGRTSVD